jgi:drug/metabolite transporter (DMT)-like permease
MTNPRAFGLAMVGGAAVLWSTAGVFVRLLDLDVWTVLAWRSSFAALSLIIMIVLFNGRRTVATFASMGTAGLLIAPVAAASMIAYVVALKLTTVANVMVVYATVPFIAAGIAFAWIGERPERRVIAASLIALLGIWLMVRTAPRADDVAGSAAALLMTCAFALQMVMARRYPAFDMSPVNALAAILCAAITWPLAAQAVPSSEQLVLLALFGITTSTLAYLFFLIGARHIPSGEAGLIGLLDLVLGPLWVYIAFSERPDRSALIGGAIVVAAVVYYLAGAVRLKSQ